MTIWHWSISRPALNHYHRPSIQFEHEFHRASRPCLFNPSTSLPVLKDRSLQSEEVGRLQHQGRNQTRIIKGGGGGHTASCTMSLTAGVMLAAVMPLGAISSQFGYFSRFVGKENKKAVYKKKNRFFLL